MAADAKVESAPRSADEVRAEIERAREQIQSSVLALREEVSRAADLRAYIRRRPGLWLGAAFALGFYLGSREW
ncbi:MAG TPA: hypothetical protein VFA20_00590 [Myxococcaceae bacterium]|nr:hypothetical protein [Myxococcaceae bacterium]